jgi:hypothetical protein
VKQTLIVLKSVSWNGIIEYSVSWITIIQKEKHHHQPINVPTAGAQAFLMDNPQGEENNNSEGEYKGLIDAFDFASLGKISNTSWVLQRH